MNHFRPIDREAGFLMPPSVDEWLPERLLARFVVEVIAGLDLRAMTGCYRGSGEAPYHPRLLLGILVYGYATGVFSSRKLERATYDSMAFRFVAANAHSDYDTIVVFRRRFLPQIEALFVQVLMLAREMGMGVGAWMRPWWRGACCEATFLPCRSSTTPPAAITFRPPAAASRTGPRMRQICDGAAI